MDSLSIRIVATIAFAGILSSCTRNERIPDLGELTALAILSHVYGSLKQEILVSTEFRTGRGNESPSEWRDILLQGLNTEMGLQESTVDAFIEANRRGGTLSYAFPGNLRLRIIEQEKFTHYFDSNDLDSGWNSIFRDYGGNSGDLVRIVWVSQIGVNESHDQALIWVRDESGPLTGRGNYYMLSKLTEQWSVAELPIPHLITDVEPRPMKMPPCDDPNERR